MKLFVGETLDRRVEVETEGFAHSREKRTVPALVIKRLEAVDGDRALPQREGGIGYYLFDRYLPRNSESRAGGACPRGVVEGKHPRLEIPEGDAVLLAGVCLGELKLGLLLPVAREGDDQEVSVGGRKGRLDRIRQSGPDAFAHHQPVDHHVYVMPFVLVKPDLLSEVVYAPVDPHPGISRSLGVREDLFVHSLLAAHDRREDHEARPLWERHDLFDYLIDRLPSDLLPADRAVRYPYAGIQKSEIVVYLGDGADGRPRVLRGRLLIDRYRGRKSVDHIDVGLVELSEKLSRV